MGREELPDLGAAGAGDERQQICLSDRLGRIGDKGEQKQENALPSAGQQSPGRLGRDARRGRADQGKNTFGKLGLGERLEGKECGDATGFVAVGEQAGDA